MSYFDAVYMDHELSPRAKTVCMYLHDRANRDGESWYAIGTIASDLGLSRSTVKRAPWRSRSPGARGEEAEVSKEWWPDIQPLPTAIKKNASPAKGGLRSFAGPGPRSPWPTQKTQ